MPHSCDIGVSSTYGYSALAGFPPSACAKAANLFSSSILSSSANRASLSFYRLIAAAFSAFLRLYFLAVLACKNKSQSFI